MLLVTCKILRTNLCYDFKRIVADPEDDGDSVSNTPPVKYKVIKPLTIYI